MRISDWSSDVCSSDLPRGAERRRLPVGDDDRPSGLNAPPRKMHETPRLRGVSFQESEIWGATQCGLYTNPDMLTMGGSRSFLGAKWKISSRSEEHTSELQSLMRISYAVFCLNKKKNIIKQS